MNFSVAKRYFLLPFILLLSYACLTSQNTVGLTFQDSTIQDGYSLFFPDFQPDVFLMDPCGQIVHTWEGDVDFWPGFSVYLTDEGNLIKASRPVSDPEGTVLRASGQAGYVEIYDWDNNLLWEYELIIGDRRLHHDIEPMPNGNILVNAWGEITREEAEALGRDPSSLFGNVLFDEIIMEIDPSTSEVVWEWKASDHLIQTFNTSAPNWVGNPSAWQGRIDLNYIGDSNNARDWLHFNSIDYNEELDQIMLSSPTFGEFWIIDHSTTTAEAATSSGGRSGNGGDLMYRWGNPEAFNGGGPEDQKLFFQHAPQWVSQQLSDKSQRKGEVIVFNNRLAGYSGVQILSLPEFDTLTWNYVKSGSLFGPTEFDRTITHPVDSSAIFSVIMSSGQVLDNGNVYICATSPGIFIEVTPEDELAWEYSVPLEFGMFLEQGEQTMINGSLTFKSDKYPITFPGFIGRDLSPKGYLELNPDSTFCEYTDYIVLDSMMMDSMMMDSMMMDSMMMDSMMMDSTGVNTIDLELLASIDIYPNPATDLLYIDSPLARTEYTIISIEGKAHLSGTLHLAKNRINIHELPPGFYLIKFGEYGAKKFIKRE